MVTTPRVDDANTANLTKRNQRLDQKLKDNPNMILTPSDIHTIIMNLINRKRFNYKLKDIAAYLLRCLCFRKLKIKKWKGTIQDWNEKIKKHY